MKVAVEITDFRKGYMLMKELREREIPFSMYTPGSSYEYILTTSHPRGENWIYVDDPVRAVRRLILKMCGKERLRELWIGIDPGLTPAVAVVGDRVLLERTIVRGVREVVSLVDEMVSSYPAERVVVKVGAGDRLRRNALVNMLITRYEVMLVSERNTSEGAKKRVRDLNAAESIAFAEGRTLNGPLSTEVSDGDLKEIQRMSREASGGRITISRSLARRVALGEMTLEDALLMSGGDDPVR